MDGLSVWRVTAFGGVQRTHCRPGPRRKYQTPCTTVWGGRCKEESPGCQVLSVTGPHHHFGVPEGGGGGVIFGTVS